MSSRESQPIETSVTEHSHHLPRDFDKSSPYKEEEPLRTIERGQQRDRISHSCHRRLECGNASGEIPSNAHAWLAIILDLLYMASTSSLLLIVRSHLEKTMDSYQTEAGQTVLTKEETGKTFPGVLRATDDEGTIYGNNVPNNNGTADRPSDL